jgi:putative endonuclease
MPLAPKVVSNLANSGSQAELLAEKFLQRSGLVPLLRNYHCRYGEIDLIMLDGKTFVFVEVRLRSNRSFGGPAASIDTAKQKKILRAAQHYLSTLKQTPPCRFDAVLFKSVNELDIEWIKNAFTA